MSAVAMPAFGSAEQSGSLATLANMFDAQIATLRQATALRCPDMTPHAADLGNLEAVVQTLEHSLQHIQAAVARERSQLPEAQALADAFRQQAVELAFMSDNLPQHLPAHHPVKSSAAARQDKENDRPRAAAQPAEQPVSQSAAGAKKARLPAPRRYITVQELESVPSYMRSRLTLDKVNAAVDDIAALAEANLKLVSAARGRGTSLSVEDRRHAQSLIRNVAGREEVKVKGCYWLMERDCKHGTTVKMDKSGKAMLTILRHLGRLSELHCQMDEGKFENVYILL